MRYNHNGFTSVEIFKILYNHTFVAGIKRIGCFVQEYVLRIFIYCTGYQQPLLLALTQPDTVHTNYRII